MSHHLVKENMRHLRVHGRLEFKLDVNVDDTGLGNILQSLAELPSGQEVIEQAAVHAIRTNITRFPHRHMRRVSLGERRKAYDQVALQELLLCVVDVRLAAPGKKLFVVFHVGNDGIKLFIGETGKTRD